MELKKNKKNVIIIILAVLLLISIGMICFLLVIKNTENDVIEQENNQNVENNTPDQEENNETNQQQNQDTPVKIDKTSNFQILQFLPERSLAVLYDEEVYVSVDGYYDPSDSIETYFGENAIKTLQNVTRKKYVAYGFNNIKILDYENNQFIGMKLDIKDVKSIYAFISGQDYLCNYGLLFLTENNEVYSISLRSLINGEKNVTHIDSLKEIVEIKTEYGMAANTYAIDSKGNRHKIIVPSDFNAC